MKNFLKEFVKNPRQVWTFLPCFNTLVYSVLSNVDFQKDLTIVEYWPGNWNFTCEILQKMTANSQLISLEINDKFYNECKKRFQDDRLKLINDWAENIDKYISKKVSVVLSWIPLSAIDKHTKMSILNKSYQLLSNEWIFLQYQYFSSAKDDITKVFDNCRLNRILCHFPPAIYYLCKKNNE